MAAFFRVSSLSSSPDASCCIIRYILPSLRSLNHTIIDKPAILFVPSFRMHARARRVPAERARHAKRLGHVQIGPGHAQVLAVNASTTSSGTTTATTQQSATAATSTTSTSADQSPSSALPSSSHTQSSSLAPSSATTPSQSSLIFSTSTQSPPVTASSSSFIAPPTTLTSTFPTSSSSSTSTPQTNAAAVTSSGLSGGAIAGIVAGAVIVGTALIVFFVRKTYLRRRERRHISWNGVPGLHEPNSFPDVSERPTSLISATNTPQKSASLSPFEPYGQSMYTSPAPPVAHMHLSTPTYAVPMPPPATYNNPTLVAPYPTQAVPSTYIPGSTTALAMGRAPAGRAQHAPVEAIVRCTFVPTLPDELSIVTGERIFIVEQYDDGWVLCASGRGERGMVPRECLERAPSDQPDIGWRNVNRISSLNHDARRF